MSKVVKGTLLLTGATFLSKFLGMLYVIPFFSLVGADGGKLYSFAYVPYNILISIATVGVPLAVSKFVAKYNALGDYHTGMRILKSGMILMLITGMLSFIALFLSADWIANFSMPNEPENAKDAAFVIRMVSFALIIVPVMSIGRGFFQGYQSMKPTSISMVIEQIVRIVFLLSATYIIKIILDGSTVTAVGFSTFAAFIGALASCIVLIVYWKRRKPFIQKQLDEQRKFNKLPMKTLMVELLRYAGPFVLVGIATPLYQLVDQFTFSRALDAIGWTVDMSSVAYSAIILYGHKLILIPVTIGIGLSMAMLPALTDSFTHGNKSKLTYQINQALQIIAVLVIPAACGLLMLSDVAYGSLFSLENINITGPLLAWYAPVAVLFALFTVSSSILQGVNQQKFAVISLTAGLLMKVMFNIKLIHIFGPKGAIFGTALAVGVAVVLNLWKIHHTTDFSYSQTAKRTLLVLIFTFIMSCVIAIMKFVFGYLLPYETSRTAAVLMLSIGVISGGFVYLWLGYYSTLLERVLGSRVRILGKVFKHIPFIK